MSADSSHAPLKPSLATLPPELMRLIISDPLNLGGNDPQRSDPYSRGWLGVKLKYSKPWLSDDSPDATEAMSTLRTLSQTCRSLRNFTLPLIWAVASVSTIDQLGRMCQVLRADPSIAAHIKSFSFSWDMDGDYFHCDGYTQKEAGSLLELAFTNRLKLWDDLRRKHRSRVEYEGGAKESLAKWFRHEGRIYDAPGRSELTQGAEDEYGLPAYDSQDPNSGGDGPDGSGEDKLIKSAPQFEECIAEVVSQLCNLQKLSWDCPVVQMSAAVLLSLTQLDALTALHLNISSFRDQIHNVPYWKLVRNLESLSIDFNESYQRSPVERKEDEESKYEEQDEATHAAFELPKILPTTKQAIKALHTSIATRTIITAVRNGYLKHLSGSGEVQPPFAMRTLLTFWITLESFSMRKNYSDATGWVLAASSLRPLLAHASLWLHSPPKQDRLLSRQDIQALQAHFEAAGIPKLTQWYYRRSDEPHPVGLYLAWLAEDEKLAQQVADAWSTIVESGQAGKIPCHCDKCQEHKKQE